jgi:uncharacterized protein
MYFTAEFPNCLTACQVAATLPVPDFTEWFVLAIVLSFGIFVQSAAGFAAGLLIVPTLLWAGFSIPEAQASLLVATIPQNIWGVYQFRDHIDLKRIILPAGLRLFWLPVGMFILVSMERLPTETLRQIVGGVLLVTTLLIVAFRPQPRETLHVGWGILAFSMSGFLQGLVGMGGPAMVLWVQAHHWGTKQTRGFLFIMYLVSLAPAMVSLWYFFGERVVGPGLTAAILIPWLLWITSLGLRAGTWLGRERLRRVTLGLLLMMGLAGLLTPLFR